MTRSDVVACLVPGDKSVGIRALLLSLLAEGPSQLRGLADCRITTTTIAALRTLGAVVDVVTRAPQGLAAGAVDVVITPPVTLAVDTTIDCAGSATLARLLMGLLAGRCTPTTITGSEMLRRRPMARVAVPLSQLFGRDVITLHDQRLPARVSGGDTQGGGEDVIRPGDSAQVRSAVMFAAVAARRSVTLWSRRPGRRHTEQLLRLLQVNVVDDDVGDDGGGGVQRARRTTIAAADRLPPLLLEVPGDPSAAAFFEAFAALSPQPRVVDVRGLLQDDERTGMRRVLRRMRDGGGLRGVVVDAAEIPDLVDEVPILAAVCAGASSPSTLRGLAELRLKESDRLARIVDLLTAFGVATTVDGDTLTILPSSWTAPVAPIRTDHDHRLAMTALVMGAVRGWRIELDDVACVDDSWAGFDGQLTALAAAFADRS